jgi:hypothetical protein
MLVLDMQGVIRERTSGYPGHRVQPENRALYTRNVQISLKIRRILTLAPAGQCAWYFFTGKILVFSLPGSVALLSRMPFEIYKTAIDSLYKRMNYTPLWN